MGWENSKETAWEHSPAGTASGALWQSLHELEARCARLAARDETNTRMLALLERVMGQGDVRDMCRAIVEGVREILCIDRVGLFLWDAEGGCFHGTYGTAIDGQTTDEHDLMIEIWPGAAWEQIVQGAELVRGCELGGPEPRPGEEEVTADLLALRHDQLLYGVLSVDNRIARSVIPAETLEQLRLLSPLLANIVELSRARAALARSAERFMRIAEHNAEWIWELDGEGRYTYCSPVAERIVGYKPGELLGRSAGDLVIPEEREMFLGLLRRLREQRDPRESVRNRQVHRDGRIVQVQSVCIPLVKPGGEVSGFWGAHRDVTRELELETALRHSQKMDAIGRLAGGIAHDFNNLLTTIIGGCGLLLDDLVEGDPVVEEVKQIQAAGERAARLTQQLLAYSRKQIFSTRRLNLNEVVRGMEELLRRTLGEDIEMVVETDTALPDLNGDPDQLEQVVLQLVVNGREAMVNPPPYYQPELWPAPPEQAATPPRRKRLMLRTGTERLDEAYCARHPELFPGVYVTLSVEDTGVGMTPDVQENIFEPFFTTKKVGEGSGLGLSTVYGIVKQMGGDVQVLSRPGEGSRFTIFLPRAEEAPAGAARPAAADTANRGTETILVVEDDEKVRRLMIRMLSAFGYQTLEAGDGMEALEVCRREGARVDMIITDMIMPRMTGKTFVETLRGERADARVLFMSGYSRNDAVGGEALGADIPFIQKPFTRDELVRMVRQVLDSA